MGFRMGGTGGKPLTEKNCPYCEGNYNPDDTRASGSHAEQFATIHHMMKKLHDQNPEHFHKQATRGISFDDPVPKETDDKLKAEEGMGGMNMGAQRGLGHEAGYKQDPGQSAQITEVPEEVEEESEGEKTAKQIIGGGGIQEGLHLIGLSAYENHEQDESPETEPNKQQIPTSKPKTDVFKSLYKKALIIKYKNIYKPLNT